MSAIEWLKKPDAGNYPAAAAYLGLVYEDAKVTKLLQRLRRARIRRFKAKDIFRASGLSLLGADGYHRLCAVYSFDEDAEIPCQIV